MARYGKEYHAACKANTMGNVNDKVSIHLLLHPVIPLSLVMLQSYCQTGLYMLSHHVRKYNNSKYVILGILQNMK